ncbi:MAG: hypothetical protein MZW92_35690 [Comamonadaceae bacterium]|nr:hypothetical protein [Comamonadaceae bacterium]
MVYQEQVMQIAQVIGGYIARRRRPAAPRDGQEEARGDGQAARRSSVEGAAKHGVDARTADELFDLMEKFAGYGFNKIARRGLRAGRLPHRLAQGALPGRVHAPPTCRRKWTTPTRCRCSTRTRAPTA